MKQNRNFAIASISGKPQIIHKNIELLFCFLNLALERPILNDIIMTEFFLFLEMNSTKPSVFTPTAPNTTVHQNISGMDNVDGFTTSGIVIAFFVTILILTAIAGNLVVCISFTMFRNLRSMTNYFLVNLGISDILVATCVMPIYFLYALHYPRPFFTPDKATLLEFWQIMDFFLCLTSVCTLATIAIERNLAISQPFYYTKWISPTRVYVTIAVQWMFGLTVSVITQLNPFGKKSDLSVFIVSTSYFLPLIIILIMYTQIWLVARRQARRLRQDGALATDFKAIKTIAIVIGTFFVCYTPNMIIIIWTHFGLQPKPSHDVATCTRMLMYFNSSVNPIIYSYFNKTYRRGFKRLFQVVTNKLHELRSRAGDKKPRTLQRSRLSLNITMRSSAGSLLDGPKLPSLIGQSGGSVQCRGSPQAVSQNVANHVEANERICDKKSEELVDETAENAIQDTQQ